LHDWKIRVNFSRYGDWYRASRVTGPTHNLLGLEFGSSAHDVEVVAHPGKGQSLLDPEAVLREVQLGIGDANSVLKSDYSILRIEFVLDDSGPVEVYRWLARLIVERLHAGEPF